MRAKISLPLEPWQQLLLQSVERGDQKRVAQALSLSDRTVRKVWRGECIDRSGVWKALNHIIMERATERQSVRKAAEKTILIIVKN